MKDDVKRTSGKGFMGVIPFLAGFVPALIYGWVFFPGLLYSQKPQPINFSHAAHKDSSCQDCHSVREDGTYSGIPRVEKCKECHESQLGQTEDERILVEEYIQGEKEIPWRIYSWQPDNVYFTHAPHTAKGIECVQCHRDVSNEEKNPVHRENRLTGYSRETMGMITCEKCHAKQRANNNCEICHK